MSQELKDNDLLFPVHEEAVLTKDGKKQPFKQIVRSDTDETIAVHTEQYQLVPNNVILEQVDPVMDYFGGRIIKAENFSNRRFYVQYELPEHGFHVSNSDTNDDIIHPRLVLTNSYDGMLMFRFMLGAYRLVCSNGMVIPVKETHNIGHRHKNENIEISSISEDVETGVNELIAEFNKNTQVFEVLAGKKSNEYVFNAVHQLLGPQAEDDLLNAYGREGHETLWNVYNAGTRVITHHMESERRFKLEDQLLNTVQNYV